MIWKHSKNDDWIISSEKNVTRCTGHETISSSDGLFWRSATLKSWIRFAIHCIQQSKYDYIKEPELLGEQKMSEIP